MGLRWFPKSAGAVRGDQAPGGAQGGSAGPTGTEAIAAYGWGEYDPETGLFEGYDPIPAELLRPREGTEIAFDRILQAWSLVEYSFHAVLGVDLDEVRGRRSWRWFMTRLRGLLQTDTPLARYFVPSTEQEIPRDR